MLFRSRLFAHLRAGWLLCDCPFAVGVLVFLRQFGNGFDVGVAADGTGVGALACFCGGRVFCYNTAVIVVAFGGKELFLYIAAPCAGLRFFAVLRAGRRFSLAPFPIAVVQRGDDLFLYVAAPCAGLGLFAVLRAGRRFCLAPFSVAVIQRGDGLFLYIAAPCTGLRFLTCFGAGGRVGDCLIIMCVLCKCFTCNSAVIPVCFDCNRFNRRDIC